MILVILWDNDLEEQNEDPATDLFIWLVWSLGIQFKLDRLISFPNKLILEFTCGYQELYFWIYVCYTLDYSVVARTYSLCSPDR